MVKWKIIIIIIINKFEKKNIISIKEIWRD
jgi:hypothetical protein